MSFLRGKKPNNFSTPDLKNAKQHHVKTVIAISPEYLNTTSGETSFVNFKPIYHYTQQPILFYFLNLADTAITNKRDPSHSVKLIKQYLQAIAKFNNLKMNFTKYFKRSSSKTSLVNSVNYDRKASMDSVSTFTSTSSNSTVAADRATSNKKLVDASKGGSATDAFNYLFNNNTNSTTTNGVRLNYSRI
ncbi:hypothetical protein BX070DRAFT_245373 [Coemansia spiralis]|nr:hypothetical protein BX070DRAFT_245373 [Coemansia spiralis]